MKNLWWLAWLGVSSLATFAEEKPGFIPSPLTMSDEIPGRPWDGKGAGEFKGPLAAALKELLGAGFPDPAGLPYHKIEIRPTLMKLLVPGEGEKPHHDWKPMEWAHQAADLKAECERRIKNGSTGMLNEAAFIAA